MIDEAVCHDAINSLKALEPYLIHEKRQKRVAKLISYLEKELIRTQNHKKAQARTHIQRNNVTGNNVRVQQPIDRRVTDYSTDIGGC